MSGLLNQWKKRRLAMDERKIIVLQDVLGRETRLSLDQAEWLLLELKEGRLKLEHQEHVMKFLETSIADYKQKGMS